MDLMLGGVTVNLIYLGPSHSDNLIQVHVPQEKVLVGIDIAKGKSLFPDYRDMDVHSMLKVLKALEHMPDVDIVLPGHGPIVDQENFGHQRRYIQALRDEVLAGIVAGDTLQQMRDTITMEEFSDYRGFDGWLDSNIVTMWGYLYRFREPNERITPEEAVACREDINQCRTSDLH